MRSLANRSLLAKRLLRATRGLVLHGGVRFGSYDDDSYTETANPVDKLSEAEAIQSAVGPGSYMHKVVLDIDHPVVAIPSSTDGHWHLIIDHEMPWADYEDLLSDLALVGVIEKGYAKASIRRGYSTIRAPWVEKGNNMTEERRSWGKRLHGQVADLEGPQS